MKTQQTTSSEAGLTDRSKVKASVRPQVKCSGGMKVLPCC